MLHSIWVNAKFANSVMGPSENLGILVKKSKPPSISELQGFRAPIIFNIPGIVVECIQDALDTTRGILPLSHQPGIVPCGPPRRGNRQPSKCSFYSYGISISFETGKDP